jgi:SAM-dependent methyltransferase
MTRGGKAATSPISTEQRRQQYELERRAAREILESTRADRIVTTQRVYDRLYREAPWHPDLQASPEMRLARVERHASLFAHHVRRARHVLELGCGSGELLNYLAERYENVSFTGVDISVEKMNSSQRDRLSNLVIRTGDAIEPHEDPHRFDLVISSQVLEHFHPDDVPLHLRSVYGLLAPGGVFVLDTPNRYTGPHDVSAYFSTTPSGTHLKEWTVAELRDELHLAGFSRVMTDVPILAHLRRLLPISGDALLMPAHAKAVTERIGCIVPRGSLRTMLFRIARMDNIMLYASADTTRAATKRL